jgi:hypothetical protein
VKRPPAAAIPAAPAPAAAPPAPGPSARAYLGELAAAVRQGWPRFWFAPADPITLAAIRVATGLVLLYVHGSVTPVLPDFVGPEAYVDRAAIDRLRELTSHVVEFPGSGPRDHWLGTASVWLHVTHPAAMWTLQVLFLAAIACFTIGLGSRVAAVLVWIGNVSFLHRGYLVWFGLDTMTSMLTLYLMLGPTGAALSVDRLIARRRGAAGAGGATGTPPPPPRPRAAANLVVRLIQVHMCIVYLAAGAAKLQGSSWWDGTAVYLTLMTQEMAPADVSFIAARDWLWQAVSLGGTALTLAFELGFPFLVWSRLGRPLVLAAAVLVHTGIGVTMGLGAFSAAMLTGCLAFVPPAVLRALAAGRRRRRAEPAAPAA